MEKSSKRLWAARLLSLAVMSLGLSLMAHMTPESIIVRQRRVVVMANENIGEIVSAVEALGRDDINIKTTYQPWSVRKPALLWGTIGLFVAFGVFLAIYHTIYCAINGLLGLIKEDGGQLHRPLTNEISSEHET